ncbi:MAG: heme A synthase [Planctomycetota bacterium]
MTSALASPLSTSAPSLRGPFRLAVATMVVTVVTIIMGALTTSTGSGMAYADWPLSDGQLMPESSYTELPHFFEHFHRVVASSTGLFALALWIWLLRNPAASSRLRWISFFGGFLILTQGVIGGTGVLNNLPAVTSVAHGTIAQLILATFGWIAYLLSDRFRATAPILTAAPGAGRKLAMFALVILVAQTIVGAIARHTNSSHALWTHVGNALVVFLVATIATAFAVGKLGEAPGIRGLARFIVLLLIGQIALGFVALAIRNEAGKTPENINRLGAAVTISTHVLIGAVLTVLMASLAAHVFRATRRDRSDGRATEGKPA